MLQPQKAKLKLKYTAFSYYFKKGQGKIGSKFSTKYCSVKSPNADQFS